MFLIVICFLEIADKIICVLFHELGLLNSDTSDEDNIPLSKLATNNLSDSDSDVPLSILRQM